MSDAYVALGDASRDQPRDNGAPSTYASNVERLIDPTNVGTIQFVQGLNGLLPKAMQRRVMATTAKKAPLMGFVVEPSSSFLCFDVTDVAAASALLPEELAKSVADVDFDRIKPLSVAGLTTLGGA